MFITIKGRENKDTLETKLSKLYKRQGIKIIKAKIKGNKIVQQKVIN